MAEFRMPSLGADMVAGTLVDWNVKAGDRVKRGDIIALVETDKGLIEVEVFEDGVVNTIHVEAGTRVPVGTALAFITPEGGAAVPPPATAAPAAPAERLLVSPSARKLAQELGVDLGRLMGTGPHGAIQRDDVEKAARAAKEAPPAERPAPSPERPAAPDYQAGMRRAIAAAMGRSNQEIPHYYLETEIDMERPLRWLEGENLKRPIKERLLPAVLPLKAVAQALGDVPELNGHWLDDRLQVSEAIHIGFAIALRQGGLITPAIHHVDTLGLDELMAAMRDLITRTRAGRLRSSEMTDATITVTNLGDLGVKTVFGVIYPPQVALVGLGRITERPWAENGMLGIRRVLTATLAADHRATDGHRGSQFLEALTRHLQAPETL